MNQTRREFTKTTAMASAAVIGAPALLRGKNLNDKIRVGFIGVGNRGTKLLRWFMANDDVDVAALCDVYDPYMNRDNSSVDQRFIDHWVDREISVGDFVLTGGEIPALVLADAIFRQCDGALGHRAAHIKESFQIQHPQHKNGLLEYPHYTRPPQFRGFQVPEILVSGNHEKVNKWRLEQALKKTRKNRPDLLSS